MITPESHGYFLLKSKSKVNHIILQFRKMVKTLFETHIKRSCTNNAIFFKITRSLLFSTKKGLVMSNHISTLYNKGGKMKE